MNFILDLFTPETWAASRANECRVVGFTKRQLPRAKHLVRPGDVLLCYLIKLSRWCGALEVEDGPFEDETPLFLRENDPWTVRYKVKRLAVLDEVHAIPIKEPTIWQTFSKTKDVSPTDPSWAVRAGLRSSLSVILKEDGEFLLSILRDQVKNSRVYELSEADQHVLRARQTSVATLDGAIQVTVPGTADDESGDTAGEERPRESLILQAKLADIGATLGYQVWIPRNDRAAVRLLTRAADPQLLDRLPLNFDNTTLKTIEHIDVLWLKKRRIVRAFEVEHTTSVYSGLLRMADLLALQPNIDIRLHIVAPHSRREKVFTELQRPVFSFLEKGPLSSSCTYISYESVERIATEPHLAHMHDSILEKYEEPADEVWG